MQDTRLHTRAWGGGGGGGSTQRTRRMMPALGQSQFIARYRSDWLLLLLQAGRQAGSLVSSLSCSRGPTRVRV